MCFSLISWQVIRPSGKMFIQSIVLLDCMYPNIWLFWTIVDLIPLLTAQELLFYSLYSTLPL